MGLVSGAFKATTNKVGDFIDGVGDRLSVAHISNKVAVETNAHNNDGFLGKIYARVTEAPKNLANTLTLGQVRIMDDKLDMKELDDMSKSERYENIASHVEEQSAKKQLNAASARMKYAQAVERKHSKTQNDGPEL